ncbi:hypothetical protein GCM10025870_09170 [Agromyces marinus]|uniref:HpcH/HpaI aldolase/citrate lyase domain-containing protein n=1 Tax=Agromyces marinus TaxID=1389020 RepID=A0ABM8GZF8_9MICO|nr:hypothetical protein GCM10025870_09170 [Agromyces marinus]
MWVCSGSPLVAEIAAGSGLDWVLIDAEHSPNGLESVLAQLQAVAAYPVAPVVRVPFGDTVTIKQFLDLGVQNLLVPMVDSAEQAAEVVRATRYPQGGVRGVGAALARASRWNRVEDYLAQASSTISVFAQVESAAAIASVEAIAATPGWTACSSARRTSRPRWGCSGSRGTRMSSPPSSRPSARASRRASRSA